MLRLVCSTPTTRHVDRSAPPTGASSEELRRSDGCFRRARDCPDRYARGRALAESRVMAALPRTPWRRILAALTAGALQRICPGDFPGSRRSTHPARGSRGDLPPGYYERGAGSRCALRKQYRRGQHIQRPREGASFMRRIIKWAEAAQRVGPVQRSESLHDQPAGARHADDSARVATRVELARCADSGRTPS